MKTSIELFALFLIMANAINAQVPADTIEVVAGWNMVGSLYNGEVLSIIRTEPSGIISSEF